MTALSGSPGPTVGYGQFLEGDWGLSGITASPTNPVYLSLLAPSWANSTMLYYNSGGGWTQVTNGNVPPSAAYTTASDLTFNGTYYSFDLTGTGGFLNRGYNGLGFDGFDYAVVGTPLPGDANLDGKVDINDLTIVLAHYGQTGMGWSTGEFTGSGTVDINDLTIVLAHYGQSAAAPASGGIQAVPEPCGALLLAAALAGLTAYAWRKCKR